MRWLHLTPDELFPLPRGRLLCTDLSLSPRLAPPSRVFRAIQDSLAPLSAASPGRVSPSPRLASSAAPRHAGPAAGALSNFLADISRYNNWTFSANRCPLPSLPLGLSWSSPSSAPRGFSATERTVELYIYIFARWAGGKPSALAATISRAALSIGTSSPSARNALDSVCLTRVPRALPPLPWPGPPTRPLSSALLGSSVISVTTLYATLIIVGVMSSRKSSKTQPRRVPRTPLARFVAIIHPTAPTALSLSPSSLFPSLSRSFARSLVLVSSVECQRVPLPSSFSARIPRETPHHRVFPRS